MDEDLAELLKKFSLEGNELLGATLELGDLQQGVRACEESLIGRVIGKKVVNFTGVKNFVTAAWGYPRNITVMELGPNIFQFNIPSLVDKERSIEGGPWVMDNQLLVLNRWKEGIEEDYRAFMTAPLWVQLWNLPVHWLSKEVGNKIGVVFKEVREVLIPQNGGKDGRHLKILALVDLSKPLLRGTVVKIAGALKWIAFKYERCPDFCYSCGLVGHSERSCKDRRVTGGSMGGHQYGPWLRAGNTRSSPQKQNSRNEGSSDKKYWRFQEGELIEQDRSRSLLNQSLLENLLSPDKEGHSSQKEREDREKAKEDQGRGASPVVEENKGGIQDCSEDLMNLETRGPDLPLVIQVEEEIQSPMAVEVREEDRELEIQNQNQGLVDNEDSVGALVTHQESMVSGKVQEAKDKQAKRMFRRLKSPTSGRRALKELNENGASHSISGKRKVLLRDEEMEEANSDIIQWKKTKPMLEFYSAELKGEVRGTCLKGTPLGS
nr:uncharacterized protein LOC113737375 [Coffea arabica]